MPFIMMALKLCKVLRCHRASSLCGITPGHFEIQEACMLEGRPDSRAVQCILSLCAQTAVQLGVLWTGVLCCLRYLLHHFLGCWECAVHTELWLHWNLDEHSVWTSARTAGLSRICHQSHRKDPYTSSAADQQPTSKAKSYSLRWLKKRFCLDILSNLQTSYKNRTKRFCILYLHQLLTFCHSCFIISPL